MLRKGFIWITRIAYLWAKNITLCFDFEYYLIFYLTSNIYSLMFLPFCFTFIKIFYREIQFNDMSEIFILILHRSTFKSTLYCLNDYLEKYIFFFQYIKLIFQRERKYKFFYEIPQLIILRKIKDEWRKFAWFMQFYTII